MACPAAHSMIQFKDKERLMIQTRREMLAHSATVAGLLATAGLLPQTALAAWPQAAFDAKTLADAVKALGGGAPAESKDVTLTGPDIAENGAVVPVGCASALCGNRPAVASRPATVALWASISRRV